MALAVMQYCAENSVDALTRARMEAMAEIMDDPGKWGQHTAAEAKLAAIMKECAPQRKKAGSKLAQVRAMSSAARNAKGRKASGN